MVFFLFSVTFIIFFFHKINTFIKYEILEIVLHAEHAMINRSKCSFFLLFLFLFAYSQKCKLLCKIIDVQKRNK